MTEPYYSRIKDPQKFLKRYLSSYEGDYKKAKAQKIISLFPQLRDKKVLDLGCGGGFYSLVAMKKRCENITLLDISPTCVKAAKVNLLKKPLALEGVVADAASLPLRDGYFDFVLCIDLIEHLQKDDALLHEIRRVSKDNALMLIATQNSNSINYILEAPINRYLLKNHDWMGWDSTHLRFYTPKRLLYLLKNCGFFPIEVAGTYFLPYFIVTWLGRINRGLSGALYHIIKQINIKLELKHKAPWDLFGWGIVYLCVKYGSLERIW